MEGDKKVIVVFGATGAQGGGVVNALLVDGDFKIRGVTRNLSSEKAEALKSKGVEMVKADLDDVDSLKKAMEGAYGAFFLTNFWEHMDAKKEMSQLKNLADAASASGIQHVVNSTLEDTRKFVKEGTMPYLEDGEFLVAHFDAKGEMQDYVGKQVPTTQMLTSFYSDNFINFGMGPKKGNDDEHFKITFPIGNAKMPLQSAKDIGVFAVQLFKDPSTIGTCVGCYAESLTGEEIANTFVKVFNTKVEYNAVPPSVYASFGFPGAAELANMFQFFDEYEAEMSKARKPISGFQTLEEYLIANKSAFSELC